MGGIGDITWCWVFFQLKCISQRRKCSSSWHCSKDPFKNQTCTEDCTRDMTDTGKGEWGGGQLTDLLKQDILPILRSLGTLPLTVREPGFTLTSRSMDLLKQDEVLCSRSQSSSNSRPEGMAVGSHMQNLARSSGKWPAFLYRKHILPWLYLNQKTVTAPRAAFSSSQNTRR